MRRIGADEAEKVERQKRGKINPDVGFSSFEAASARKYHSLVKQIKPDFERYQDQKEKAGDAFYASAGKENLSNYFNNISNINSF